ncbi:Vegetative incompatibility protein HET-E-1 [Cladobotryum mycophilum]|uniref:Vegetative incompatibility protein HET-E-1 n=1 Tax=Cladobotryum mycophilum TaxID=491253 RepID=A0ABR0SRV1_9HYPO
MRLLNTSSLKLQEFDDESLPTYVILSHTWGQDEVLFDNIQDNTAAGRKGYAKVLACCQKAAKEGFEWVWIDTCCINKASSAELSDAINSMYKWYKWSAICYAYLQDITDDSSSSSSRKFTDISKSRWFKRGWTLQELLAPRIVEFYTSEWSEIGTKTSLASRISAITRIPTRILRGDDISTCSVAERMSWASERKTTRYEDWAYSLLGLFNVNMPPLYGEGTRSFIRLQELILRQEEDYSIFAWMLQYKNDASPRGLLAEFPLEFRNTMSSNAVWMSARNEAARMSKSATASSIWTDAYKFIEQCSGPNSERSKAETSDEAYTKSRGCLEKHNFQDAFAEHLVPKEPPRFTSRGLLVSLPVRTPRNDSEPTIAWVYCKIDDRLLCIFLQKDVSSPFHILGRRSSQSLLPVGKDFINEFELTEMFLHPYGVIEASNVSLRHPIARELWGRVQPVIGETDGYKTKFIDACPNKEWLQDGLLFRENNMFIGNILLQCMHGETSISFKVWCGIFQGNLWCWIVEELRDKTTNSDLRLEYKKLSSRYLNYFSQFSDRAANRSSLLPDAVLSASIHKSSGMKDYVSIYTLRIAVQPYDDCDYWARQYLSEVPWRC